MEDFGNMNLLNMKVSPDEFKEFTGIDLGVRLIGKNFTTGNNVSNETQAFIDRIQRRLNNYILSHFRLNIVPNCGYAPSKSQIFHYKLAVIEQVLYVFNNEAITEDMGLDENGSARLGVDEIEGRAIGYECYQNLQLAGIANRNLRAMPAFGWIWWAI